MNVSAAHSPSVAALVQKFESLKDDYRAADEARIRRELIDPLFANLGWDVNKVRRLSGAQLEVIHEDRAGVTVDGQRKYPDYCFRLSNARKFFVEAKRPATSLKSDRDAAFQIRRYGWSAGLPFNVVTNFEEFIIYDCRQEPMRKDPAETGRLLYLTCQEYVEKWDEIASWFSRAAVAEGSLDRKIEWFKIARGAKTVDASFLERMSRWRQVLARCIAEKNPALTQRQLNYVVQMTIDRIVFLRICEDRDIEPYQRLHSLTQGDTVNVYPRLCRMFREADDRYNSGLFHFTPERERDEKPDSLSFSISIPDKPLEDIIKDLYPPYSPYAFSVMPAEILGRVYEQFLGSVIRVASNREVFVEEKPEVRKAGGVYYTPAYIVDYIVKNTVGKLLEGKTLKQAAKLRILDPACGSGSFLIGAYQFLLDWHLQRHVEEASGSRRRAPVEQTADGDWRLTVEEKKRILLTHIFGVDIDAQAVEVAKLSLLLKTLEGETRDTIDAQIRLFHERALPDLSRNIKCGNALIGPDFYQAVKFEELTEDDHYRVNVFDWSGKDGFPDIMKSGGFDAVIGNPPYVRIQAMKEWSPLEAEEYKRRYVSASKGNYDIYVVFVEKGLELLNKQGKLGFIVPNKFLSTDYGEPLRIQLAARRVVDCIVDFGHSQVFKNATTYTCLLFLDKSAPGELSYLQINPQESTFQTSRFDKIPSVSLSNNPWLFSDRSSRKILEKIKSAGVSLLELPADISRGTSTGADHVYCLEENNQGQIIESNGKPIDIEKNILRIPIYATDYTRYFFRGPSQIRVIFPYTVKEHGHQLLSEENFSTRYPKAYEYLSSKRSFLEQRKQFNAWYGYSAPRSLNIHENAHILVPLLADRGLFTLTPEENQRYCLMAGGGFSVRLKSTKTNINFRYLLGIINSKLLFWNLRQISNKFQRGWITCTKQYFGTLSIRTIDFSDGADVARHDAMVQLVERMINLHKRLQTPLTQQERMVVERQIAATDREIDELTYDLYALTPDERRIIEDATA
jgi:hypothetical protein